MTTNTTKRKGGGGVRKPRTPVDNVCVTPPRKNIQTPRSSTLYIDMVELFRDVNKLPVDEIDEFGLFLKGKPGQKEQGDVALNLLARNGVCLDKYYVQVPRSEREVIESKEFTGRRAIVYKARCLNRRVMLVVFPETGGHGTVMVPKFYRGLFVNGDVVWLRPQGVAAGKYELIGRYSKKGRRYA